MIDIELNDETEAEDGESWDDPREAPRTGATIIRKRWGRLSLEVFAPLLMEYGRLHKPDATNACGRGGGILADNIEINAAEALAEALRAHGEDCFVVPAAHLVALPRERPIRAARLTRDGVALRDAAGHSESGPWKKGIVLAMAHVSVTTTTTKRSPSSVVSHRAGPAGGGIATKRSSDTRTLADMVFLGKLRRYRISAPAFDYSILRDQLQPRSEDNILALVRQFLGAAPHLRTNFDAQQLASSGETEIPTHSTREFDDVVHWLINLVRFDRQPH